VDATLEYIHFSLQQSSEDIVDLEKAKYENKVTLKLRKKKQAHRPNIKLHNQSCKS